MTYIFNRKSMANTLALHYFEKADYEKLFYFAEKWLCNHGFKPNRLGGKGRSNISFSRGKQSLMKEGFDRFQEKGLWMACLPEDNEVGSETFDYKASIYITRPYENILRKELFISWDDTLVSWKDEIFLSLVGELYSLLKPAYGYAFQRVFDLGPGFYTAGVITGLRHPHPEREEITRWGIIGTENNSLYKPHFIRDVYPLNFLSPQHLEGPVGGQTLRQWIESDPARGTLTPVVGDLTCWTVDPAHIPALREELLPHNILICFMDY